MKVRLVLGHGLDAVAKTGPKVSLTDKLHASTRRSRVGNYVMSATELSRHSLVWRLAPCLEPALRALALRLSVLLSACGNTQKSRTGGTWSAVATL